MGCADAQPILVWVFQVKVFFLRRAPLGRYGGINEDFVLVDGWENARPTARKRWSRVSVRRWYSRSSGERLRLGRAWSAGIGWRRAAVSGAKTRSKSFKKIRQTEYPSADKR